MVWSHSHTAEAYDIARKVLETWEHKDLVQSLIDARLCQIEEAEAEPGDICSYCDGEGETFLGEKDDLLKCPKCDGEGRIRENIPSELNPTYLDDLPDDILVDAVMEQIEKTNLCDNGGGAFWIDSDGFWTVSLGDEE